MFDTQVTVVGNLVADPRMAFTKDGQAIASFRVASTARRFDRATAEWRDGETLFTGVTCFRGLAENVVASLKKGCGVIVLGRLNVRPWETKDGDKRQSVEIDAMAVGSELGRAVTIIKRAERGQALQRVGERSAEGAFDAEIIDDGLADAAVTIAGALGEGLLDNDDEDDDLDHVDGLADIAANPAAQELVASSGRWRRGGGA
jgi:single-strand DNA-binding protein